MDSAPVDPTANDRAIYVSAVQQARSHARRRSTAPVSPERDYRTGAPRALVRAPLTQGEQRLGDGRRLTAWVCVWWFGCRLRRLLWNDVGRRPGWRFLRNGRRHRPVRYSSSPIRGFSATWPDRCSLEARTAKLRASGEATPASCAAPPESLSAKFRPTRRATIARSRVSIDDLRSGTDAASHPARIYAAERPPAKARARSGPA